MHTEMFKTKPGDILLNSWPALFFLGADNATSIIPYSVFAGNWGTRGGEVFFHRVERPHLCWLSDFKWYLACSDFLCFSPESDTPIRVGLQHSAPVCYLVEANMIVTTCMIPAQDNRARPSGKIQKFKLQIQNHELLFMALFKFSSYYSNSWHYSKYQVLFIFRIWIWIAHEHSPESGSGTQTSYYSRH